MSNAQKYQQPGEQGKKPMHGEAPDDELMNGPVTNRGCTDCLCLLLFFACTGFMIYIIQIGFHKGQPLRLTYPFDPDNRACGNDLAVQEAPYIYLVAPYKNFFNRSVCVSECPNWRAENTRPQSIACVPNKVVTNCTQRYAIGPEDKGQKKGILSIDFQSPSIEKIMNYSVFVYNSTPVFDRICLPSGKEYLNKIDISQVINIEYFTKWVSDIQVTWPIIALSAGLAVLIGLVYMILMRYCSGLLTWVGIILYFVAVILLISFMQSESGNYQVQADNDAKNGVPPEENQKTANALKYLSYALIALLVLSVIAFICYFTRIRLAIAIIKTASLYVLEVPFSLLVPPVFAFIVICFWLLWFYSFVYVYAVGDIKGQSDSPFATITWDEDTRRMLYFHFFMALWYNALFLALCAFILASSVCIWYFSKGPGHSFFQFPLLVSTKRGILNHLGSLAFGAFLLAVVQFIRVWLEYINYQMMKVSNNDPPQPLKCLLDCGRCYAAYFERFISFLNKNAYIQIALTGKSFIPAAKDGFYLVYNNPGKFAIVNGIGHIFTVIGKLFICFSSTYICYIIITKNDHYRNRIFSPFLPTLCFFIVTYFIGELFMMVYGMSIDTILQCSIVDEEINKKKGQQPKYCPEPLKEFYHSLEEK